MARIIRLITVLAVLVLLCTAALAEEAPALRGYDAKEGYVYVTLGQFEQTAEGDMLPILWRVLAVDGNAARLCSEYVLLAHRTHGDDKAYNKFGGDFAQTELSQYLNGEFAEHAFTEAELAAMIAHEQYGKLYLLTAADLKDKSLGFGTDAKRKAWATPWAKEVSGVFVYQHKMGSHSPYWVMDRSTTYKYGARCVKQGGDVGYINVITLNEGCRPACVVDMTMLAIVSGAGTMEDPFVLQ